MKPVGAKLPEGTGERRCDGMRAQRGMRRAPSARFMQAFTTNLEGNTPAPPGWAPPASQHLAASGELGSVIWEAMGAARGRPTPRGPWLLHETAPRPKPSTRRTWDMCPGSGRERSMSQTERRKGADLIARDAQTRMIFGLSRRAHAGGGETVTEICAAAGRWHCPGRAPVLEGLKDCGVQRQSSKAASRVSDQSEHDSGSESAASRSI